MLLNFIFVPNLAKIPQNFGSLGSSHLFRRRLMQQVWKKKINEIIATKENVFIVEDEKSWEKISSLIYRDISTIKAVGFDCEWNCGKDNKRKPVTLLQLATYSGNCVLFRLNRFQNIIPPSLKELLEDRNILKVGVACCSDASYFSNDYGVNIKGWMDLRHLAIKDDLKNRKIGLKSLSEHYLGKRLYDSWKLRGSDWERETLTTKQIMYASEDALVGIRILLAQLKSLWKPVPQENWETSVSKAVEEFCHPFVEVKFTVNSMRFCFVCGKGSSLQKSVVLQEYVRYYPKLIQHLEENFLNILLCDQCNEVKSIKEVDLRRKLAKECDAPLDTDVEVEEIMIRRVQLLNSCKILKENRNSLPLEQIQYLENNLRKYLLIKTPEDLVEKASNLEAQILKEKDCVHGYNIYKYYEKIGLIRLTTLCRDWFLDSMKPKYIPHYFFLTESQHRAWLKTKIPSFASDYIQNDFKTALVGIEGDLDVCYSDDQVSDSAIQNSDSKPDHVRENSSEDFASLEYLSNQTSHDR